MFTILKPPVVQEPSFEIKVGDLEPGIESDASGNPGLFNGATVRFEFWQKDGDGQRKGGVARVQDGAELILHYDWQPGDTAAAGDYYGEWKISYVTGRPMTLPATGYVLFRINP